ncbi:hypothetical protein PV325_013244, partial [Microctonus aethiopoides]
MRHLGISSTRLVKDIDEDSNTKILVMGNTHYYDEADPIGHKIEPALPEHLATGRDNELAKMELF